MSKLPPRYDAGVLPRRFEAIRERLKKATPGPWFRKDHGKICKQTHIPTPLLIGQSDSSTDAELMANAPTDLALCLEALSVAMEGLKDVEWNDKNCFTECKNCGNNIYKKQGTDISIFVADALAEIAKLGGETDVERMGRE